MIGLDSAATKLAAPVNSLIVYSWLLNEMPYIWLLLGR